MEINYPVAFNSGTGSPRRGSMNVKICFVADGETRKMEEKARGQLTRERRGAEKRKLSNLYRNESAQTYHLWYQENTYNLNNLPTVISTYSPQNKPTK